VWDARCCQAFETLKSRLCSAPVLATLVPDGDFVLDVDTSTHGAGAILRQYQNGELRVIGYASRLFNAAERSYCTTRKELAAVVFGLKRFRQYILGRKVLVRSDHAALSYLRCTKDPVAQQARWLDFIEQFDITVRHRSGSAHWAADALSRRPCEGAGPCNQCNRKTGAVVKSAPQYENWGDAVVIEPRCAGVVTREQARRCTQDEEHVAMSHPSLPVSREESAHQHGRGVPSPPNAGGEVGDPPTAGQEGVGWTTNELEELQQIDPNTGPIRLWLQTGVRPPREFLNCDSLELGTV